MKRTFTLAEANALLSLLEPLLRKAMECHDKVQQAEEQLQQVNHHVFLAGGTLLNISDMLALKARWSRHSEQLRSALAEIEDMGVLVKDLVSGLLDFPCKLDDEIVLLCWQLGEPTIAFWHTVEDGFKGRKPIDGRIGGPGYKPI